MLLLLLLPREKSFTLLLINTGIRKQLLFLIRSVCHLCTGLSYFLFPRQETPLEWMTQLNDREGSGVKEFFYSVINYELSLSLEEPFLAQP